MAGQGQQITRNAQDQAQAITAGNNWAQSVMPLKMAGAMGEGRDLFTLGDVLQLAATLYAPAGLSGGAAKGFKSAFDVSTTAGQGGSAFAGLV